eukprot:2380257-Amphidinium_carterae.1
MNNFGPSGSGKLTAITLSDKSLYLPIPARKARKAHYQRTSNVVTYGRPMIIDWEARKQKRHVE